MAALSDHWRSIVATFRRPEDFLRNGSTLDKVAERILRRTCELPAIPHERAGSRRVKPHRRGGHGGVLARQASTVRSLLACPGSV